MPDELIAPPVEGEQPATAEPEQPPETPPEEEAQVDQTPDPAALKAEIEQLKDLKKKAEEDARYWRTEKARQRAEYFRERGGETPPAAPGGPAPGKDPVAADFDSYDKFVEAKIAHEVNKAKGTWDREAAQRNASAGQAERESALQTKLNEGYAAYSDFEEVALDPTLPITPVVKEILHESENPAAIAYYLGKNRTEAVQIARMNPVAAIRAIAKIEEKLKSNPQPTPKKISDAPAPINPIKSRNTISKDPANMTQKEYEEWRKSQGARLY